MGCTLAVQPHVHEHDWHSTEYVGQWIARDITRDEERKPLLRRLVSFINQPAAAYLRVLDIGAGYGLLSEQVLEAFPNATLVLHDYSEPMFEHAKRRLSSAAGRVSFVKADLLDPNWNSAFQEQFDTVVSAIAIHNVRAPERIRGIYGEIFPLVKPGGCFLNYDLVFPTTPELARIYRHASLVARQQQIKAETGVEKSLAQIDQELPQGRTPEQRPGEPATLENQLRWLREAGFEASDCLWKDLQTAIVGGFRG